MSNAVKAVDGPVAKGIAINKVWLLSEGYDPFKPHVDSQPQVIITDNDGEKVVIEGISTVVVFVKPSKCCTDYVDAIAYYFEENELLYKEFTDILKKDIFVTTSEAVAV